MPSSLPAPDYQAIAQRFFRSERPRLREALLCVDISLEEEEIRSLLAAGDPRGELNAELFFLDSGGHLQRRNRSIWERMYARGLISADWLEDPGRCFRYEYGPKHIFPHPTRLQMAVLLASDQEALRAVEALAREALQRALPWGGFQPPAILWKMSSFLHHTREKPPEPLSLPLSMQDLLGRALIQEGLRLAELRLHNRERYLPRELWDAIQLHHQWETLARTEWKISRPRGWPGEIPAALEGRPFASLRNPYTPLLQLWGLGYAVKEVTREHLVLFLPLNLFPGRTIRPPHFVPLARDRRIPSR